MNIGEPTLFYGNEQKAMNDMSKIKEINIKTTDGDWWRLLAEVHAINDETIANRLLAETSVPAGRIWTGPDGKEYIDGQVCINTANIIAIEVIRESEG